jgi:hypothetical protein
MVGVGQGDDAMGVLAPSSRSQSLPSPGGRPSGRMLSQALFTFSCLSHGMTMASQASLVRSPCATNRCPTASTLVRRAG